MSPVSRGRKTKKNKQGTSPGRRSIVTHAGATASPPERPGSTWTALADMLGGPRQRPEWFDQSINSVLDGVGALMRAQGPRELDDAAAQLLGAEQHRRLHTHTAGFWFDWWFTDLAEAAALRAQQAVSGPDRNAWQPYGRLLHAMTGLGSPALAQAAHTRLVHLVKAIPRDLTAAQPTWLRLQSKITATGQLWQVRDGYGGRIGLIAGFAYPGGVDPSVFLFDIDACGFITLAGAGTYDDVEQAAAAWRASVGQPADAVPPTPVDDPGTLHALVHWDDGEQTLKGDEPRAVMDNWFRARRRLHELHTALRKRRTPLPAWQNLYLGVDAGPVIEAFTTWYTHRHGTAPDPDAAASLAYEWLEGALPGTERVIAPARTIHIRALIDDWTPDDPVTIAAKALLPDWIRWNGEQDHLPTQLLDAAVDAATDPETTQTANGAGRVP